MDLLGKVEVRQSTLLGERKRIYAITQGDKGM